MAQAAVNTILSKIATLQKVIKHEDLDELQDEIKECQLTEAQPARHSGSPA